MNWKHYAVVVVISGAIGFGVSFLLAPPRTETDYPQELEPLPDSVSYPSEAEKRAALLEEARHQLEALPKKFGASLQVCANCEAAASRIEQQYGEPHAGPMMIASMIVRNESGPYEHTWLISGVDPRREMDAVILLGTTSEGRRLRVIYHVPRTQKYAFLVLYLTVPPKFVEVQEFLKAGKAVDDGEEIEVHLEVNFFATWQVPDLPNLIVAIRDRNGQVSNYVEVLRSEDGESASGPSKNP